MGKLKNKNLIFINACVQCITLTSLEMRGITLQKEMENEGKHANGGLIKNRSDIKGEAFAVCCIIAQCLNMISYQSQLFKTCMK